MVAEDQLSLPGFELAAPARSKSSSRLSFEPVDINGGYHSGYLYYPTQTLVQGRDIVRRPDGTEESIRTARLETVVLRSDRTLKTATMAPAPKGTPKENRLWTLDELVIAAPPRVNRWATWRWPSIECYLSGKARTRPLKAIMADITAALKSAIHLPREEDYTILSFCVPLTFVQQIFDAVPLILVTGPAGTGKSAVGQQMAQICCNAAVIGKVSAATVARQVDEARGLTVLDDLESIAKRKGNDGAQYSDFVQWLKLSYCKQTATTVLTDVTTMTTRRINFFGVKIVTNTRGVDDILGTRMFRIDTAAIPHSFREARRTVAPFSAKRLQDLRDELHTWSFCNARAVASTYARMFPQHDNRADEITAPLRVLAELAEDDDLRQDLEQALRKQREKPPEIHTVEDLLRKVVEDLVLNGQTEASPQHVLMQMRLHAANREARHVNVKDLNSAWVGRMMRLMGMVDTTLPEMRRRLYGLKLRILPLSSTFVLATDQKRRCGGRAWYKDPVNFCTNWECKFCRYYVAGCPISVPKLSGAKRGGSSNASRTYPRPPLPPTPPREEPDPRPSNPDF
jgi:hypothetical protein